MSIHFKVIFMFFPSPGVKLSEHLSRGPFRDSPSGLCNVYANGEHPETIAIFQTGDKNRQDSVTTLGVPTLNTSGLSIF